jgi:hypothetical protein
VVIAHSEINASGLISLKLTRPLLWFRKYELPPIDFVIELNTPGSSARQ